jgi:lipid II:glycine glycyltransferase (peptidoglycan interpeptide bridge formation enzyme)
MVKKINDFDEYQVIIKQFNHYHFAQSKIFWNARKANGVAFSTFAYYKGDELLACAQVLTKNILKNKEILLIPFGPVMKVGFGKEDLKQIIVEIINEYPNNKIVFVQVNTYSSDINENEKFSNITRDTNLIKSSIQYRHADGTAVINLNKTPNELFVDFRKDVKANIKKADKNVDLSIEIGRTVEDYDKFWTMYENTQSKKGFVDQRKELYKSFLENNNAFIISMVFEGRIIASVFCLEYKEEKTLITFLSSTTDEGNRLKAPTYLRWKLINYAYDDHYEKLDFFSVDKRLDGPSSFKMGFRGEILWFNDSYDYVVDSKFYTLYKFMKFFKK